MNNQIKIVKDNRKIGTKGIEGLGYFEFVNGNGKQTRIEVIMNVNSMPAYWVYNTGYSTLYFEDLQRKYIGLKEVSEVEILTRFF